MKNLAVILFIFSLTSFANAQTNIDKIVNGHIAEFKQNLNVEANMFLIFEYDQTVFSLGENDKILTSKVNFKEVKGNNNFLVKFILIRDEEKLILKGINFRIKKMKGKKLEFVNLMNGKNYVISGDENLQNQK